VTQELFDEFQWSPNLEINPRAFIDKVPLPEIGPDGKIAKRLSSFDHRRFGLRVTSGGANRHRRKRWLARFKRKKRFWPGMAT